MANFRDVVEDAIYSTLNVQSVLDKATGGVWNTQVPNEQEPPWVVFQAMSKVDDDPTFTIRGVNALYMVKAVSDSPYPKEASAIDTLVDAVLRNASLSITGFSLLWCRRESDIYLTEDRGGEFWTSTGGLYRIVADES
ncbi:hypothetical protein CMI37_14475 [Candidatus Pacearchaeota archaeon]|nr:hypothetical protein [Candidatus Pacearchaeota archaeon]